MQKGIPLPEKEPQNVQKDGKSHLQETVLLAHVLEKDLHIGERLEAKDTPKVKEAQNYHLCVWCKCYFPCCQTYYAGNLFQDVWKDKYGRICLCIQKLDHEKISVLFLCSMRCSSHTESPGLESAFTQKD